MQYSLTLLLWSSPIYLRTCREEGKHERLSKAGNPVLADLKIVDIEALVVLCGHRAIVLAIYCERELQR
jgi:orotidine-5'-phosphate decarboxylase